MLGLVAFLAGGNSQNCQWHALHQVPRACTLRKFCIRGRGSQEDNASPSAISREVSGFVKSTSVRGGGGGGQKATTTFAAPAI